MLTNIRLEEEDISEAKPVHCGALKNQSESKLV